MVDVDVDAHLRSLKAVRVRLWLKRLERNREHGLRRGPDVNSGAKPRRMPKEVPPDRGPVCGYHPGSEQSPCPTEGCLLDMTPGERYAWYRAQEQARIDRAVYEMVEALEQTTEPDRRLAVLRTAADLGFTSTDQVYRRRARHLDRIRGPNPSKGPGRPRTKRRWRK